MRKKDFEQFIAEAKEDPDFDSMDEDLVAFLENLKAMAPKWKDQVSPEGEFVLLLDHY